MSDLEISPPFDPEDLPLEMEDEDMTFDLLEHVMPGNIVYFALGAALYLFNDQDNPNNSDLEGLFLYFTQLGELAEKPGTLESKTESLKTRNYRIVGKRSSTAELSICGLSEKMKNYLESSLFSGTEISILIMDQPWDGQLSSYQYKCLLFDAMMWTVDWSGEADELWTVTISTAISGSTKGKILPFTSSLYL